MTNLLNKLLNKSRVYGISFYMLRDENGKKISKKDYNVYICNTYFKHLEDAEMIANILSNDTRLYMAFATTKKQLKKQKQDAYKNKIVPKEWLDGIYDYKFYDSVKDFYNEFRINPYEQD